MVVSCVVLCDDFECWLGFCFDVFVMFGEMLVDFDL